MTKLKGPAHTNNRHPLPIATVPAPTLNGITSAEEAQGHHIPSHHSHGIRSNAMWYFSGAAKLVVRAIKRLVGMASIRYGGGGTHIGGETNPNTALSTDDTLAGAAIRHYYDPIVSVPERKQ
ncbi:hypothetical protein FRC04_006431 [Tulasnella sp. 424]|nr:hypothetical protein FRC04_006431 [Tulasnella sp. 424]KAG8980477.1 hypothetical protein FRC05_006110 [Tulasnella sp. 425]